MRRALLDLLACAGLAAALTPACVWLLIHSHLVVLR